MNVTSALMPVLDFLDQQISEHWELLFFLFVIACLSIIAWILSGGMRPKNGSPETTVMIIPFVGPTNHHSSQPAPRFPGPENDPD